MATQDLYFLFNAYTGLVKIGIAADVPSRVRGLECACGVRLEVLAVFPGQARYEAQLHEAFTEARQLGEWFVPTPDLIGLIEQRERVPALLARYATKIDEYRRIARANADALTAERRADSERQRERLADVRAEERRIKREEAERRAKAKQRREARQAAQRDAERFRIERERATWAAGQPAELAATSVVRGWTADRHADLVAERSRLVRRSQRARNTAHNGIQVTTDG